MDLTRHKRVKSVMKDPSTDESIFSKLSQFTIDLFRSKDSWSVLKQSAMNQTFTSHHYSTIKQVSNRESLFSRLDSDSIVA